MLRWPFVASALAIVALIIVLLLVSLVQGHKQLRSVQKAWQNHRTGRATQGSDC